MFYFVVFCVFSRERHCLTVSLIVSGCVQSPADPPPTGVFTAGVSLSPRGHFLHLCRLSLQCSAAIEIPFEWRVCILIPSRRPWQWLFRDDLGLSGQILLLRLLPRLPFTEQTNNYSDLVQRHKRSYSYPIWKYSNQPFSHSRCVWI